MTTRYFAYGSNLMASRMCSRVAGAQALGTARLRGFRLAWDKRGGDGSGKANLRRDARAHVWGVVYAFDAGLWPDLDAHEGGYERFAVEVALGDGTLRVQTYRSELLTSAPPFDWYKRLVVEGARAHGLPEDWLRRLAAGPDQPARKARRGR